MKRVIRTIAAAMAVLMLMSFTAFAADTAAFSYKAGETILTVGSEWNAVHNALGKEKEVKKLTNCADGKDDKAYIYELYDVTTTCGPKKKEIIKSINLKSTAQTPEGLKLGALPAEVKKLYPKSTENFGLYTVVLGDTQLVIDCGFKNDKVVGITYEIKR